MTRAIVLILSLLLSGTLGCATVPDKALDTARTTAAGNDRYTALVIKALAGKTSLEKDGIASVSTDDLKKTPKPVLGLVKRLLEALHTNRFAWHSALFQVDKGPDPETLELKPVKLPDESDGLLENE